MARISYHRLATAMVSLLDKHDPAAVSAAVVAAMTAGGARPHLERLLPELERELVRQKGHAVIHATTARKLPSTVVNELAQNMTKQLGAKTYELESTIDPGLLGGARLTTADASLDLSLRSRLEKLGI